MYGRSGLPLSFIVLSRCSDNHGTVPAYPEGIREPGYVVKSSQTPENPCPLIYWIFSQVGTAGS